MEAREIYNKLLESYKEGNKARTAYYGEQWFALKLDNPFKAGTVESDLYLNGSLCFLRWERNDISCRRARVEVYEYAERIAALNLPNPYAEKPKAKQTKKVKQEEPMHVLGIVPETQDVNDVSCNVSEVNPEKEPEDDPKKGFFSKHKKR